MDSAANVFEIERQGDTVIVTPVMNLGEFAFHEVESEAATVLSLLDKGDVKNVVLDFHRTDHYGSTALGFFIKLLKRVRSLNGRMALCNVSAHEMDILRLLKLDKVWPICTSRDEALAVVRTAS